MREMSEEGFVTYLKCVDIMCQTSFAPDYLQIKLNGCLQEVKGDE